MAEDFPASVYTFYTADEVSGLLEASGFERVDLAHAPGRANHGDGMPAVGCLIAMLC
jgi:hypothetical protein